MTKIIDCGCPNEQQDKMHGKGKRVANRCKPGGSTITFRCTSCSRESGNDSGKKKK